MSNFERQLSQAGKESLAKMSMEVGGNWWRDLLSLWSPSGHKGGLRLAFRNGYMNFYSCGQSIARIQFSRGKPTLSVHRKYVVGERESGQRYVKLQANEGCDERAEICAWGGAEMLRKWISNSARHRGPEKHFVDQAVTEMPTVIDLEMGLPAYGSRTTPLRMDMVALESRPGRIEIVFWEAKRIGDKRLRSRSVPKVFKQVRDYEDFLSNAVNSRNVIEAYRRTCQMLRDFHTVARSMADVPSLDPLVIEAARDDSRIEVASKPGLLIFDDGAKRDEEVWQAHLERLSAEMPVKVIPPRASL